MRPYFLEFLRLWGVFSPGVLRPSGLESPTKGSLHGRIRKPNSTKEETVLLQIEAEQSKTFVPKRLKWNEITIPEEFKIENPQNPRDIEKTEISDIIEENYGTVLIRFNSFKERPSTSYRYAEPSRKSYSEYSFQQPIKVFHKSPLPEVNQESYSPTSSQMRADFTGEINMIKSQKPFINNSFELMKDFGKSKYFNWFSGFDRNYQEKLVTEWITCMNDNKFDFIFEIWLKYYLEKQGIQNPYEQSQINVQTSLYKKWQLTDGNTVTSIYPPLQSIKIPTNEGEVTASPFKRGKNNNEPVNIEDIKKVYHQNNYSNQMLHTITQQIDHLSTEIKTIQKDSNPKFPQSYSTPHFQPTSLPVEYEEKIQPMNLLGRITQALEKINENISSSTKITVIEEQNGSESEDDSDNSNNSLIQQVNQIEDDIQGSDQNLEINRINTKYKKNNNSYRNNWNNNNSYNWHRGNTRNYYPRPTPPDIQYEEKAIFKSSYDGTSVYEWNIDGKSEYEILNTLQEIGMAVTAYKTKQVTRIKCHSLHSHRIHWTIKILVG